MVICIGFVSGCSCDAQMLYADSQMLRLIMKPLYRHPNMPRIMTFTISIAWHPHASPADLSSL